MQVNHLSKVAAAVLVSLALATACTTATTSSSGGGSVPQETTTAVTPDPCASVNPCASNPCASVNPCAGTAVAQTASAAENVRYFVDNDGLAIRGTDPVAYFTQGGPVAGSAQFTYTWNNATWQFASAENRDLFAANPAQYAPQYGGFCAWAVSQGYTASIDPNAWRIVDGKLYLNYSKGVQRRWERDIPGNISKGDANWPGVLAGS